MSTFAIRLTEDMKTAMRAKDTVALNVVRNLKSAMKYAAIEKLGAEGELDDVEAIVVVRRELKKMQDSADGAEKAGRPEAVEAARLREFRDVIARMKPYSYIDPDAVDAEVTPLFRSMSA
jgi:uncharacterized protein YqeY